MIANHLKMAARSLVRQRGYSVINIVGLAIGLTVCLLVTAYIVHELSFEACHSKRDRIFRVQVDLKTEEMGVIGLAGAAPPMGPALKESCPEVEAIARFRRVDQTKVVAGTTVCKNKDFFVVEPDFLRVFDVEVVRGNPSVDLAAPSTIYLTESFANSLFGRSDPIGKSVTVAGNIECHVAGILKDPPSNTKLRYDALGSYSSLNAIGFKDDDWTAIWRDYLYVLVRPGTTAEKLESVMAPIAASRLNDQERARQTYRAQSLSSIYFNPRPGNEMSPQGNPTNMLVFGAIALLTLAIAMINFINHTTARTAYRVKELSVRKVVGADRSHLISQLLMESLLTSLISGIVAMAAYEVVKPVLDMLLGRHLSVGLQERPSLIIMALGLALLAGLCAGLYPALYLSRVQALRLRNPGVQLFSDRRLGRRALVVFQFTVAVILTVVAVVVMRQIQYSRSWDKGFDDHDVLLLEMEGRQGADLIRPLKDELLRQPDIAAVTACDLLPGTQSARINMFRSNDSPDTKPVPISMLHVDPDFAATLGIKIAEGRQLGAEDASSDGRNIVLDRRAVRELGLTQPVGSRVTDGEKTQTVVGVLGDFKTVPTFTQGWPVLLQVDRTGFRYVLVKLREGHVAAAIDQVKEAWRRVVSAQPFEYSFLRDVINEQYGDNEKFGSLLGALSVNAVLIACLGILGLVSYSVERRRKEISIRKVVGATTASVVRLLGSEFVVLVVIANILACPVAWYFSHRWLQRFAYRVEVGPSVFLLAGGLALAVAILSVLFQSLKAAYSNPAQTLKYE